jgi:hypothetical protein
VCFFFPILFIRRKLWQAEYMISGIRDNALAHACIRHGIPAVDAALAERLHEPLLRLAEGTA